MLKKVALSSMTSIIGSSSLVSAFANAFSQDNQFNISNNNTILTEESERGDCAMFRM